METTLILLTIATSLVWVSIFVESDLVKTLILYVAITIYNIVILIS